LLRLPKEDVGIPKVVVADFVLLEKQLVSWEQVVESVGAHGFSKNGSSRLKWVTGSIIEH
jgi:hypothetical protein